MSTWSDSARQPVEQDRVPVGKSVLIAMVVLATFVLGVFFTGLEQAVDSGSIRDAEGAPVTAAGRQQVGIVDQPDFELGSIALPQLARQRSDLEQYGWVDRANGRIHLPIDRAMQLLLERGEGPAPAVRPVERR